MSDSLMTFQIVSPQYKPRMLNLTALGTTGVSEIQQLTCPAVSAATQGDYAVFSNLAGQTIAVWLDIDANGTVPTGAAYVAATFKAKASVATGDLAAAVKTAVLTALGTTLPTVTFASSGSATISATSIVDGNVAAPARHNTGDTGNGSFVVATLTPGNASLVALQFGKFDATIAEAGAGPGDYVITFNEPWVQIPEVVALCNGASLIPRIKAVGKTSVEIEILNLSAAATDADFHLIVVGSQEVDLIS